MANRREVVIDGGSSEELSAECGTGGDVLTLTTVEGKVGAPGVARTPDLQIRSLPLYPSELQAQRPS